MFRLKQVEKQNSVLPSEILNFEFPIDLHYLKQLCFVRLLSDL